MKKMKIVSGLMAMAMTAMSMGIVASAADSVQVKIGTDEVDPGAKFSVDVDLAGVPTSGLTSVDFAISYDPSIVKVTDVSLGSIGNTGAKAEEGELGDTLFSWYDTGKQIVVIWATGLTDSKYFIKSDGTFLTLSGTVDSSAKAGASSKLDAVAVDREEYPGSGSANSAVVLSAVGESGTTDYTAAVTAGAVKVKGGNSTVNPTDADWGNVNCSEEATVDQRVNVADAVLLARFAASDKTVKVTKQGELNGDVNHDGVTDSKDLQKLLQYLGKKIKYDELTK